MDAFSTDYGGIELWRIIDRTDVSFYIAFMVCTCFCGVLWLHTGSAFMTTINDLTTLAFTKRQRGIFA